MSLLVKLLREGAVAPERKTAGAAGYDLCSCEPATVPASGWSLVDTGIAVTVPEGTYGRIAPRSGLGVKGIAVGAGVVDRDYRGSLKVLLFNHSAAPFEVRPGDRVAQLVCERIATPPVEVVELLSDTDRGDRGFGSTGVAFLSALRAE